MKTWQQTALVLSTKAGIVRKKKGEETRKKSTFLSFIMQNSRKQRKRRNLGGIGSISEGKEISQRSLEVLRTAEGVRSRCAAQRTWVHPSAEYSSHDKSVRWQPEHFRPCPAYGPHKLPLGLLRTRSQSIPAAGSSESTHLLLMLTLFYLVSVSRDARKEVRASQHLKSHQMNAACSRTSHWGGGCSTTRLVHREKPIKCKKGNWR